MKATFVIAAAASLACTASASPVQARDVAADEKGGFFDGFFDGLKPGSKDGHDGIFGQGPNFFSTVFDSAACIVSSFIGGGNPLCKGRGDAVVTTPSGGDKGDKGDKATTTSSSNSNANTNSNSNSKNNRYSFTYDTNKDGSLKVEITLDRGGTCTYNLQADGKPIKEVVNEAAKKCLDKN